MLQQDKPEDYVIATNEVHSVREFVEVSFREIGREIVWEGEGENEVGKEKDTGIIRIKVDPKFYRPAEVVSILFLNKASLSFEKFNSILNLLFYYLKKDYLQGNPAKAEKNLGWKPTIRFPVISNIFLIKNF